MSNFHLFFKNNKIYVFLYSKLFFVQEIFPIIFIKNYSLLKKFWFFYVLKILFHFGLICLYHPIFQKTLKKLNLF